MRICSSVITGHKKFNGLATVAQVLDLLYPEMIQGFMGVNRIGASDAALTRSEVYASAVAY